MGNPEINDCEICNISIDDIAEPSIILIYDENLDLYENYRYIIDKYK